MPVCLYCKQQTNNPKFCSRNCAATHLNKIYPKRKPEGQCKTCGKLLTKRLKFCKICGPSKDITLAQAIYKAGRRSDVYTLVRARARRVVRRLGINSCQVCGYTNHYQVAHIKPIASFSHATLLSVINAPINLATLCPNCHWELDHGLITVGPVGIGPT